MNGQMQFQAPPLTKTNKIILITCGVFFLLQTFVASAIGINFAGLFGLSGIGVSHGFIHQILTFPLAQSGFMAALFNGLIIWFIGGELEIKWGVKTYLRFLLFSYIGSGLIYIILMFAFFQGSIAFTTPLVGLTGMCFALILAYGIIFSERYMTFMLIFPMKAKYFCMFLIGIELFMSFAPGLQGKNSLGHLGAMFCGYLYLVLKAFSLKKGNESLKAFLKKRDMDKRKKSLYIVRDEEPKRADQKDPKYWQ